jgi:hypothetical protein
MAAGYGRAMKNLLPTCLLVTLVLFPACAKKHSDPAPQPAIATPPSVVGEYVSPCQLDERGDAYAIELDYKDSGRLVETIDDFLDARCADASLYSVQVSSNYVVEGLRSAGILNLQTAMTEVGLIPHNDRVVNEWNRGRGHCNINSWRVGQYQPVDAGCLAGHDADGIDRNTLFTIVKLDGNDLYRGQPETRDQDGYSAEHRFTKPDATLRFTKKGSQPSGPDLTAQCPAFAASYMCDVQGDEDFNARDLFVSRNGNEYRLEARHQSLPSIRFEYVVDGRSHGSASVPGAASATTASCAGGDLNAHTVVTRTGHPAYLFVQDRRFRLVPDGAGSRLVISTSNVEKEDASGPGTRKDLRVECRPM